MTHHRIPAVLALTLATVLSGCSRDDLYGEATFTDNVADAYADCDPGEIKFLSSKHNLRLAFRACGSNKFHHTAWSPDGTLLYFQLTHGGHLLIGEEKRIETIDLETPVGPAAWLRNHALAIPLPPPRCGAQGREPRDRRTKGGRIRPALPHRHL